MPDLEELILTFTPSDETKPISSVQWDCAQRQDCAVPDDEFQMAVEALSARGLIFLKNGRMQLSEPDVREPHLYPVLRDRLVDPDFLETLGVHEEQFVFQQTATGGKLKSGLFSRPDFTLATIRRFKYDPLRHLDVITFEAKNLAGTNLLAVHEALAHTRFGHYSYVVCPRSRLETRSLEELKTACAEHGIGLLSFDIHEVEPTIRVSPVYMELEALRKSPDPRQVEQFIEDRLNADEKAELARLANE